MWTLLSALLCACLFSPASGEFSEAMKAAIVEEQNDCRAATGAGLSPLQWDDRLAAFAQREVSKMSGGYCQMSHTTNQERRNVPSFRNQQVGENLAWAAGGVRDAASDARRGAKMWCDEKKDYSLASNSCAPGKQCGHYTQIVWAQTTKVGCGYVTCRHPSYGQGFVLSCNYFAAGNMMGQRPYDPSGHNAVDSAVDQSSGQDNGANGGSSNSIAGLPTDKPEQEEEREHEGEDESSEESSSQGGNALGGNSGPLNPRCQSSTNTRTYGPYKIVVTTRCVGSWKVVKTRVEWPGHWRENTVQQYVG